MPTGILAKIKLNKLAVLSLLLVLMAAALLILYHYFGQRQAALATKHDSLTATGTIEATNVMASFKIPGKIADLYVDEGSRVKKEQKIAVLESRELSAKLNQARGAYQAAQSQAHQASEAIPLTRQQVETTIEQARAKTAQAEVNLTNARQFYERIAALHKEQAVSDNDLDKAQNGYELAQNQLQEAQAALDQATSARIKIQVSQSQYEAALGQSEQAQGAVEEARAYLDNAQLKTPLSGYITQKFLEAGEMVNAGTPVLEITDLEHTYVKVFIDETKIGRVHLQQQAEITVDAYPDQVFRGQVVWINDAGEFAVHKAVNEQYNHNIRSFEVKINIPNPELTLKVGMTAGVKILEGK